MVFKPQIAIYLEMDIAVEALTTVTKHLCRDSYLQQHFEQIDDLLSLAVVCNLPSEIEYLESVKDEYERNYEQAFHFIFKTFLPQFKVITHSVRFHHLSVPHGYHEQLRRIMYRDGDILIRGDNVSEVVGYVDDDIQVPDQRENALVVRFDNPTAEKAVSGLELLLEELEELLHRPWLPCGRDVRWTCLEGEAISPLQRLLELVHRNIRSPHISYALPAIKLFLEHGADPNTDARVDNHDRTDLVKVTVLSTIVEIASRVKQEKTAASMTSILEVLQLCIDRGALLDTPVSGEHTALTLSKKYGLFDIARCFVETKKDKFF